MKENSAMLGEAGSRSPLIPDHPFVIEQRIALSIPVARHFERGRFAEIVLHQLVVSRRPVLRSKCTRHDAIHDGT